MHARTHARHARTPRTHACTHGKVSLPTASTMAATRRSVSGPTVGLAPSSCWCSAEDAASACAAVATSVPDSGRGEPREISVRVPSTSLWYLCVVD
jgi:hypothetical protein